MKVGLIGLGRMGNAVAFRLLQAGHEVIGFDLDKSAQDNARSMGVQIVTELKKITDGVDAIWLMVPAGEIVDVTITQLKPYLEPGLIIIDGGKTQLRQAEKVLDELAITKTKVVGVAKGEGRKPGLEKLFLSSEAPPLFLSPDSPALHLIQFIRDEAHRFAISGHRKRREKSRRTSILENIEGVGSTGRSALLKHFGGLQGVVKASQNELSKVHGINHELAERIYDVLH